MRHLRWITGLVIFAALPVQAQQPTPTTPSPGLRWAPWMGCWQVSEESVEDGAQLFAEFMGAVSARSTTTRGPRVCVTPSENGAGATITTLMNNTPVRTETVIADGVERPWTDDGCRGWQKTEWATVGVNMFARAELTCGDQPLRKVWGMATMVAGPNWVDIQLIESQGKQSVRVRRYRQAPNPELAPPSSARELALVPLGKKLTLDEITEASKKVPAEVVQAAVIELGTGGYDLKSKELRDLSSAGVPANVIDLMVAMSFPQKFVVERASSGGGGGGGWFGNEFDTWSSLAMWPYAGMWGYYDDPFYSSMYTRMYSPFYSAYYSPFGYRYWGYIDPRYRYYSDLGGLVAIESPPTGSGSIAIPSSEGRVIDGRGYTRIRRAEPESPTRVSNGGDRGGWGTSSSGGSSSSGSGSSGASSGGYSSGGSSGGGGRTAVPRPPGGN